MAKQTNGRDVATLSDFRPQRRNANRHTARGMGMLADSIRKDGYLTPMTLAADGEAIDGSARLEAVADVMGLDVDPIIVRSDGTRPVIHIREDIPDASDPRAVRLSLAANRIGQVNLDFDADVLTAIAEAGEVDLSALWREEELAGVLAGLDAPAPEPGDAEPQVDRAAELQAKWGTAMGQVWQIGSHTLTIGDGRAIDPRGRAVVFDPPWDAGVGAIQSPGGVLAFCDGARAADVIAMYGAPAWVFVWDCVSSWYTPNRPLRRGKLCLWYGDVTAYNADGAHYGDAGLARDVWNTRGAYRFEPDPRGKHLADVFVSPITVEHADGASHAKPIDWIRMLVGNCTGADVLDPFAGTGTTIVACEQLRRRCDAFEIDPGMAAVALDRIVTAFPSVVVSRDDG